MRRLRLALIFASLIVALFLVLCPMASFHLIGNVHPIGNKWAGDMALAQCFQDYKLFLVDTSNESQRRAVMRSADQAVWYYGSAIKVYEDDAVVRARYSKSKQMYHGVLRYGSHKATQEAKDYAKQRDVITADTWLAISELNNLPKQ